MHKASDIYKKENAYADVSAIFVANVMEQNQHQILKFCTAKPWLQKVAVTLNATSYNTFSNQQLVTCSKLLFVK